MSGFDQLERELVAAERRLSVRGTRPSSRPTGALALALGGAVALAVAIAALALHGHRTPEGAGALPEARTLTGELRVLREPQTAAARRVNHSAYLRAHEPSSRRTRARLVPGLTRVVVLRDGSQVYLYVVAITSHGRTQREVRFTARTPSGYSAGDSFTARTLRTPAPPTPVDGVQPRTPTALLELVPDGVAAVTWSAPRQQFGPPPFGLTYPHPITVRVVVRDNVAAGGLPRAGYPTVITWYAADGSVIARTGNPATLNKVTPTPRPGPPTRLSRRAQRDPSTPNSVTATPAVGTRDTVFVVSFTVLVNAGYRFTVTGGPHRGCAPSYSGDIYSNGEDVRGRRFTIHIVPRSTGWCVGTYHVTAAVSGSRPFGTASFSVR